MDRGEHPMSTVTVGGILLDARTATSDRFTADVAGWLDGPPVRSGLQAKAQQDGAWDGSGSRTERLLDVAGFVQEATPAAADAALRQLTALRPQAVYEVVVDNPDVGVLACLARLMVPARSEWFGDRAFTYSLTLAAPDPLLYGPPTYGSASLASATPGAGRVWPREWPTDWGIAPGTTPGAVSPAPANAGTAAYWPRLRIDGPVLNPVVTLMETGAWVRYNGELLAGQWLDWDMANRRVLLQGQVSVRHWPVTFSGNWLAIPVGGASITWTADTADPAALLHVFGYERAVS